MLLSETSAQNIIFQKIAPQSVENIRVNGQTALWVDAPYLLITGIQDEATMTRLVENGHTLIWTEGQLTYRLETAIHIAESLR